MNLHNDFLLKKSEVEVKSSEGGVHMVIWTNIVNVVAQNVAYAKAIKTILRLTAFWFSKYIASR